MALQPGSQEELTFDSIEAQIAMLSSVHDALDAHDPDRQLYIEILNGLYNQLRSQQNITQYGLGEGNVSNTAYGEALTYDSPPESSAASSASASASASRKRSLTSIGGYDSPVSSKRVSTNPSPALTPGSLASMEISDSAGTYIDMGNQTNGSYHGYAHHRALPIQPAQPSYYSSWPTLENSQQMIPNNVPSDPFSELVHAYQPNAMEGVYPIAADAVNQEWLSTEQLARFLIGPTAPGGGYSYNQHQNDFLLDEGLMPAQPIFGESMSGGSLPAPGMAPVIPPFQSNGVSVKPDPFGADAVLNTAPSAAVQNLIENIKPHDDLPPEQRENTPSAMSTELMPHQKIGLTWLLKMERGSTKGGILADEMGLGKTVQALSLILANRSKDPLCKTTLIIAPVALMKQWEKELQRHVRPSHRLSVHIYHGSGKNADFNKLRKFDVVLTTFGTLASEMKQKEMRRESQFAQQIRMKDAFGLLGRECMWYRIIIDEAQCIKNRSTRVSKASADLQAKHRLCMTGTPMMNSIDELYPLVRFLKIDHYMVWQNFSLEIAKPLKDNRGRQQDKGIKRVQALLKSIMLRRGKTSIVDGEEICKIPPKRIELQNVEFSDAEHELYNALETHSQIKFNSYLERGTVNNNYASVLVLLLRLRQACCHPHLIKDLGVQVSTEGIAEEDLLSRAKQLTEDVINRLKEADNFECPICFEGDVNPTIIIPCGHTCCGECFQKLIDPTRAIQEGNEEGGARCPHCRGALSSSKITDYQHFCKVHCPEKLPQDEQDGIDEEDPDSESELEEEVDEHGDLHGFVVPDDASDCWEPQEGTHVSERHRKSGHSKAPTKSKMTLAELKKDSLRNKAAKARYLRRLRKNWKSSAKIEKTLDILAEIQANDATEKTLIFSQFTSLLDLLEVPLQSKKFRYQRYDGSMRVNDRAEAVNKFMDEADEKILLISLKAGNAGLNLSRASQVIIMDPFWNPFIEEQAIDRAHRMPQEREVVVHRVLVPETVEDRICALQDKKRTLINAALDERAGKSLTRLNLRELQYLFGLS